MSRRPDDEAARSFWDEVNAVIDTFALASHFWWGSWAVVQARVSAIDFDFAAYSVVRLRHYWADRPGGRAV